ncbi:hypothetical protein BJY00DRAFT_286102 [Aspergillus carlsbadensis]|nr:hypothetical protein BJY00DRAFT_286102 [Aspergillus carlsbadensis]
MAYHRESFSSTSSSSSLSSFSTQTQSRSRKQTPSTQKLKLKRWFSSHLLSPRQASDSTTLTATSNTTTATTTTNTLLPDNIPTTNNDVNLKLSRTSSASQSQSQSQSQSVSSLGLKPHQDPIYNSNPEYDYNYNYYNNPAPVRNERTIHLQTEYTSANDPLSDSYAAYCRAFTSSPSPEYQRQKRTPLPRLPASSPDDDIIDHDLEIETEIQRRGIERTGTAEHELGLGPQFAIGSAVASAAETSLSVQQGQAAPSASPAIRFLPVGAHGYLPASWALPRPPTPPPGILTPERYQEMQRRAEEDREREREKKDKREGNGLTWCLPIRVSWAPWGRPKEP